MWSPSEYRVITMLNDFGDNSRYAILTKRERECLFYLLHGKSAKEIARVLKISFKTVEMHTCHIKDKLNCRNKSQLFDQAVAQGVIKFNYP
jgi:DNA-binding CsgD family transcriptional regulator